MEQTGSNTVNFLYHLQGWWHYKDAFQNTEKGKILTPKCKLIYYTLVEMWNAAMKPEYLTIYRDVIMRKSDCNSPVTYARSMRILHELGLIVYDDKSNEYRPCRVSIKRLDTVYMDWKSKNDLGLQISFPVNLIENEPESVPSTNTENESANTPSTQGTAPEGEDVTRTMTSAHVEQFAALTIDHLSDVCQSEGFPSFIVSDNEKRKAKELVRIIAQGSRENVWERITQKVTEWVKAAKSDRFLSERFYPSGIVTLINRFESEARKEYYPLRNENGFAVTTLEGKPFPKEDELHPDVIKSYFKAFRDTKKTEKENIENFKIYLSNAGFEFVVGAGWRKTK